MVKLLIFKIMTEQQDAGTKWGEAEAARYEVAKHGPDGAKFLDPHLYDTLSTEAIKGKNALDLGTGTGPWAEYFVQNGAAKTFALDLNRAMLKQAVQKDTLKDTKRAMILQSDSGETPFADDSFDIQTSINVGCNMPLLDQHLKESHRVSRSGGEMVITAPDSLLVPFTDGKMKPEEIQSIVDELWEQETDKSKDTAKMVINKLKHVLRATFILDTGSKPILITEDNQELVAPGDEIIRRIPGLAVDNHFHTADEYVKAAEDAGWNVKNKKQETFKTADKQQAYNDQAEKDKKLGPEYINNPPFLFLHLSK